MCVCVKDMNKVVLGWAIETMRSSVPNFNSVSYSNNGTGRVLFWNRGSCSVRYRFHVREPRNPHRTRRADRNPFVWLFTTNTLLIYSVKSLFVMLLNILERSLPEKNRDIIGY